MIYSSRKEAILAGLDLTPQNRDEAILMGKIEDIRNEHEAELRREYEAALAVRTVKDIKPEEPPKKKKAKKSEVNLEGLENY